MTDDEKKEIYCVARFPKSDLSHMMAGVPPDKDFSNAKPANQVSANTFLTYVDPYVRPLMEEDIAFLKEKVCFLLSLVAIVIHLLIRCRAIGLLHLSCLEEGKDIIQKYGPKRMDH